MSNAIKPVHPGQFIKENVLPTGESVTSAAKRLGVGRPALSNLLNGRAALSPEMAKKVEKTFGKSADELLALQSNYDTAETQTTGSELTAIPYVPPFLKSTANEISSWADSIRSRSQFAVFLRTLVHSTTNAITKIDFPGNDDAERPGWDGWVETAEGTPWVPAGKSGWEFGTNTEIGPKANKDFNKSVKAHSKEERSDITFVFVTPHRWSGGEAWADKKRDQSHWKDVKVIDGSILEQWLEQSISAQTWFANANGKEFRGTLSLQRCWTKWNADCEPAFTADVFAEAKSTVGKRLLTRLKDNPDRPIRLAADSNEEGLAFLYALFSDNEEPREDLSSRSVVFTEVGALSELAAGRANLFPIITSRAVEKELSESGARTGGIIIAPRTVEGVETDLVLEPLSGVAFDAAMESMSLGRDEARKLSIESGRSLTVLRRRLAQSEVIKTPEWSSNESLAGSLFAILLAGAWNENNDADKIILCILAGVDDYSEVQDKFNKLSSLDSPPVWAVGAFRGIVSKIDALYATAKWMDADSLKRFADAAELVLSERDPSLDLPEEDRWAAHIYDKTRDISASLRDGLAESMALLAIHGKRLFFARTGKNPEDVSANIVNKLLVPLDPDKLESQSSDLPVYAEAAPEAFLTILERDLRTENPVTFSLVRPVQSGLFGGNPRTGLLWALENLAWSPKNLNRVVDILARLSTIKLDDNWVNKPIETLQSIFRCWMPQTGAPLEQRMKVLDRLVHHHPDVGWEICKDQLESGPRSGDYNHKPRWRDDAFGFGEPISRIEMFDFIKHCLEIALNWPVYDSAKLGDLIENVDFMSDEHCEKLWKIISDWSTTATDEDRATLRETIRVTVKRTKRRNKRNDSSHEISERRIELAKICHDALEPQDTIQKHSWLFKKNWVPESWDEIEDEVDHQKREERIEELRLVAAKEVLSEEGFDGLLRLALLGEASYVVGHCAGNLISKRAEQKKLIQHVIKNCNLSESFPHRQFLNGFLFKIGSEITSKVLHSLRNDVSQEVYVDLFCLGRFDAEIWKTIKSYGDEIHVAYWDQVNPNWGRLPESDLRYAVTELVGRGRPASAFNLVRFDLKSVASEQIYRMLKDLTETKENSFSVGNIEAYSIKEALKLLNERKSHSQGELALLEFRYLELFRRDEGKLPNLEREIEQHPKIFCDAVKMVFKRDDGITDAEDIENLEVVSKNAYALLETIKRIPGHDDRGVLNEESLLKWIDEAQKICTENGRRDMGDSRIGQILAHAKVGTDDVWPCEVVRSVMDKVLNDRMASGFHVARLNSRGVHWRGEGGTQERNIAEQHEAWAAAMEYEYPNTAAALRRIVSDYERQAEWEDNEAAIRKRLRY